MNNFIYKSIKVFQGGSTGLVQQKKKNYNRSNTAPQSILIFIKNLCKDQFDLDIVAINAGAYYKFVEEDADYVTKNFGWKGIGINFSSAGSSMSNFNSIKKKLDESNLRYCIIDQTDVGENLIERTIVDGNVPESIGWKVLTPNTMSGKTLKVTYSHKNLSKTVTLSHTSKTPKIEHEFVIGQDVNHHEFGRGVIVDIKNDKIEVNFDSCGNKKILYSFLNQDG